MSEYNEFLEPSNESDEPETQNESEPSNKKRGRPPKNKSPEPDNVLPKKQKVEKPVDKQIESSAVYIPADDRNLTKAGKEYIKKTWSQDNYQKTRNGFMKAFTATAKEKFGAENVFGGKEDLSKLCAGIPTPSLPIEFVMANDVLPFCLMMLAGSWGSCKTSLMLEFFRWIYELGGFNFHIDTELKFDGDFAHRIMRAGEDEQPFVPSRADSLEEWQKMWLHYADEAMKMMRGTKEEPGPGKRIPIGIGLDSLAAAVSEATKEKIRKEGCASRGYATEALLHKSFFNTAISIQSKYPFILMVVNHLKTKTDDKGFEHTYTLGGGNVNFRESLEFHNSVWRSKFKNSQFEGIGVKIACAKNSFGPTHRSIKTRFLWWFEKNEDTGKDVQQVVWDWDWAICNLLHEAEGVYGQRLKDFDLRIKVKSPTADIECLANLRALGMGKEEYLPWQEVGRMIHENPEVCSRIREALNIQVRPKLINGVSLDDINAAYKKGVK